MAENLPTLGVVPGLDAVGRGIFVRPGQPHEVKGILFPREGVTPYTSAETGQTYAVPDSYAVDASPPMPSDQALNKTLLADSWERFDKQTSLDAGLAVSMAPFSLDVTIHQSGQLRQEEDCYYAMRTSFVPLWGVYLPTTLEFADEELATAIPRPFSHSNRADYARIFERYGSHYIKRAWVGGKASLVFTVRKSSSMTKDEIQAGLKASLPGIGGANLNAVEQKQRERLQSNSQCTVLGQGGNEVQLAALSSLDEAAYNAWLQTVRDNPEVIEFEAVGIWTLIKDPVAARALMDAYREETIFSPVRVVLNYDNILHILDNEYYTAYDLLDRVAAKPRLIRSEWPELFEIGFERVDAAFVGYHLVSAAGEDLTRKAFFFNRDMYVRWDLDKRALDPGYPRKTTEGWPGITFDRLDAVVNVRPDALYFFKGGSYIRFNATTNCADPGYPDQIARRWSGVTFDRLDSAVYWGNGQVYFFRGNQYIRYDTVMWRADPGYPKSMVSNYVEDLRFFE